VTATVSGAVVLAARPGGLTRFISQVTDKRSPLFHHYLTPRSFAARFGPTPQTIAAVKSQLEDSGLAVTNLARDGLILDFQAPANRVESAFRTGLDRYRLGNGSIARARTAPVQVPTTIAKYVTSVIGLDTTVRLRPSGVVRAPKSARGSYPSASAPKAFTHPTGSPTPCTDATTTAEDFGGLTDDQIANAYGVFGLYGASDTGSGQHIAVYELEPFSMTDLQTFDTCYFGATQATAMVGRVAVKNVDGGQPAGPGSGESILDIDNVSAFAPGANIDVYQAPNNTFGSVDEYAQIVNDDVDQIVTTSWGLCEQEVQQGSPGVQQAENLTTAVAADPQLKSLGRELELLGQSAELESKRWLPTIEASAQYQPYVVAVGGNTIATPPSPRRRSGTTAPSGARAAAVSRSWPCRPGSGPVPGGAASTATRTPKRG
jgi:subtilase family serine protease